MIKNIIFDLDNTIIKTEDSDSIYYKEALKNCGYDENKYLDLYNAIDIYDFNITENNPYYDKEELLKTINTYMKTNYSIKLIDELINVIGKYWTKKVIIKEEIIKKLSEKYNLYVFTNFFTEAQKKRLENIGYLKYFKKIFGADEYGSKVFKSSIEKVLKELNVSPNECVMIGDDKSRDILCANFVGMKSILYDYNGKRDKKEYNLKNYILLNNMDNLEKVINDLELR